MSESTTTTITITWGYWDARLKVGYACSGRVGQQKQISVRACRKLNTQNIQHAWEISGWRRGRRCRKGHWAAPIESGGLPGPLPRRVTILAVRQSSGDGDERARGGDKTNKGGRAIERMGRREWARDSVRIHIRRITQSMSHTKKQSKTNPPKGVAAHGSSLCLVYFT